MVLIDFSTAGQNDLAPVGKTEEARLRSTVRNCLADARARIIRAGTACLPAPPVNSSYALKAALYKNTAKPSVFQTMMSEYQGFLTLPPATDKAKLGSIPIAVLYVRHPELKEADAVWEGLQKQLAGLSDKGSAIFVADSGHFIEIDQPQALISAVDDIVNQVRSPAQTMRH